MYIRQPASRREGRGNSVLGGVALFFADKRKVWNPFLLELEYGMLLTYDRKYIDMLLRLSIS